MLSHELAKFLLSKPNIDFLFVDDKNRIFGFCSTGDVEQCSKGQHLVINITHLKGYPCKNGRYSS